MQLIFAVFCNGLLVIIGNFIYQLFQDVPDWNIAIDRSYMQFFMLCFIIIQIWSYTDG